MSRIVAAAAIRGAKKIAQEAENFLNKAIQEKGKDTKVQFPETAFYLPMAYALMGLEVKTLADMLPVLEHLKSLLHEEPTEQLWLPYLGDALDSGIATMLAEELIVALRYLYQQEPQPDCNGFFSDTILRSLGIQLVDGRMPGFAAILGAAPDNKTAVEIVRDLQKRNILTFVGSSSNGKSIIDQLKEENVELGWDTYIVPYGRDTISGIYPLHWAIRGALTFGGHKKGEALKCLKYCKDRVFAFGLALGEVDDLKYATGAGAINMGFPVIADTEIPEIRPTGICTYEHLVKEHDYKKIVPVCIEVRGVKVKISEILIPVAYSAAFEGERVRREQMYMQFGGKYTTAFEYVRMKNLNEVEDGKIEVVGPDIDEVKEGGALPLGIIVEAAGRKMQKDFEPILERQVHSFLNEAMGVFHMGQRDMCWIRISKDAHKKGFKIKHFGTILHARLHDTFGAIVDKAQVTIYTKQKDVEKHIVEAKEAYQARDERMAGMTDESVDTFYSCTLCVPKGELITLADGSFERIENVIETVAEERDLKVLSFSNPHLVQRPIDEIFFHPAPKKLVHITTTNNNLLKLTASHKVLVDKPDGLIWTKAGFLRQGDRVLSTKTTNLNGKYKKDANSVYLIDLLPEEMKVFDNQFLQQLKSAILKKYVKLGKAAQEFGIKYPRLYSVFYLPKASSHRVAFYRLTISEIKSICSKIGWNWEQVKQRISKFGVPKAPGCELKMKILDEDIMYLAGLVASDGYVRYRGEGTAVQFTNCEKVLTNKFGQIVKLLFGDFPKIYVTEPQRSCSKGLTIKGEKPVSVSIVNNPLIGNLMLGLGIGCKKKKGEKGESWTGEKISRLSPKLISAFIRGLFDGDGHLTHTHILITTATHRGAQHIFLLLKKLGISTYISKIKRGYQVGTRSFGDYIRFREIISSNHPRKRKVMDETSFSFDKNHVVRTDAVPLQCGKILKDLLARYKQKIEITKLVIDYKSIEAWTKLKCRASKEKLKLLLDDLKEKVDVRDKLYQELLKWTQSEIAFEKVKNVEKVSYDGKEVYNFSVPGTHNYLVNGIVVKNCQSFAPNHVCIVKPERLGLCGAYTWLDAKACFELDPTGPNQPIKKGESLDPVRGEWKNVNEFIYQKSNKSLERFHGYSIISFPETSCCVSNTEVIIDGRVINIGDFIKKHQGGEGYAKSSILTLNNGKTVPEKIVAMQRFPAPKKLVKLITKSGTEIILTRDHKIAIDRPEGLSWVMSEQVVPGDRVISFKKLELPSRTTDIVDLVPEHFRVRDEELRTSIETKIKAQYGSMSSAWKKLNLGKYNPIGKGLTLKVLKLIVEDLGRDWGEVKQSIRKVAIGASVIDFPRSLSPEIFYLAGLITSDGSISHWGKFEYWVDFVNTNEELISIYRDTYQQIFPEKPISVRIKGKSSGRIRGRKVNSTKTCYLCHTNNPLFGVVLNYYGIKVGAKGKWNLSRLISLPQNFIAAYLAGVFDGDGSVRLRKYKDKWNIGEAYLCIEEKRAAYHLQLLLKRLGIIGNIRKSTSVYKIELHGTNLVRFAERIPARHPNKREILQKIRLLSSENKINRSQEQVLPFSFGKIIAAVPESKEILSPSTNFYYKTSGSRPVLANAAKVIDALPQQKQSLLVSLMETDYFLDIVTKVKKIENKNRFKYVYNLTTADEHCYFANSLLIKNCGCFECIIAILPEANGFMIVNREHSGMTPCGMSFSTLAGSVGGGAQTPGFMGVGRLYIVSKKFIFADGGLKRVVWMTKELKEALGEKLKKRCEEEGDADLINKIADDTIATTSEELMKYLEKVEHPALSMPPLM